jgi:hypothetical protein
VELGSVYGIDKTTTKVVKIDANWGEAGKVGFLNHKKVRPILIDKNAMKMGVASKPVLPLFPVWVPGKGLFQFPEPQDSIYVWFQITGEKDGDIEDYSDPVELTFKRGNDITVTYSDATEEGWSDITYVPQAAT